MAVRNSIYGRPGATYLDMPDDIILAKVDEDKVHQAATVAEPPRMQAMEQDIEQALNVLESAERPLVIVGKGMAWSRAEDEVRAFVERTQVPFLASPMGKGVMDDTHPLSVGAARSHALQEADVIFLLGARLNWIMHFGLPPRFNKKVRIVQLDISPEAISQNVPAEVGLVGDGRAIVGQLNKALENRQWFYPKDTPWRAAIAEKSAANARQIQPMIDDNSTPDELLPGVEGHQRVAAEECGDHRRGRQHDGYRPHPVAERRARLRLDAGSYGTMGIGMGFAIAAAVVHPDRPIVSVSGDSAIGFSGMEIETACRYQLPVKIVVLNNGGIGGGIDDSPKIAAQLPPRVLTIGARYDKMMEAFGGGGWFIEDPKDLRGALDEAMAFPGPALVNVGCTRGRAQAAAVRLAYFVAPASWGRIGQASSFSLARGATPDAAQ